MVLSLGAPAVPSAPSFAEVGHDIVGYVTRTAHASETWVACMVRSYTDMARFSAYRRTQLCNQGVRCRL